MKTLLEQINQSYNDYFMAPSLRLELLKMVKGLDQSNHIVLTSKILDFCDSSLKEIDSIKEPLCLNESEISELKLIFMKD